MKVKSEGKNEQVKKKKKGIFSSHFFSTLFWDHHRGARSSFSLPFVYLLSSSRRRLFPTTPANQVSENGRNTAPLLLALRSAAHRTACVFSLSLSLERERERGDSTHPERSACVSPFIEWSRRVEFLQNRGRVRPIESSTTAALLMRETRKASFIYVVARR